MTSSPSAMSAGSSSRARSTGDLPIISDANMAWLLADAADVCLTGYERTMTFVEMGSGKTISRSSGCSTRSCQAG